jgi:hypothetical protein
MNRIGWLAIASLPLSVCACSGAPGAPSGTLGQDLSGSSRQDGVETHHERDGEADLDDRDGEAEHEDAEIHDRDGEAHQEDAGRDRDERPDAEDHDGRGPH